MVAREAQDTRARASAASATPRRRLGTAALAILMAASGLLAIAPAEAAFCGLRYLPGTTPVGGGSIASGTTVAHVEVETPFTAIDTLTITFPAGTVVPSTLAPADFTVQQKWDASGTCASLSVVDAEEAAPDSITVSGQSVEFLPALTSLEPDGWGTFVIRYVGTSGRIEHPCPGTGTFSAATTSGDSGSVPVTFDAVVSPSQSGLTAAPGTVPADGSTASTLTVTAVDPSGDCLLAGLPVSLSVTGSAAAGVAVTPSSAVTNAAGEATFNATSTQAGGATFSATVDGTGVTQTALVTFTDSGPTIASVEPDFGPLAGGTLVTINGTGFATSGTVTVLFGGTAATGVTVLSATSLTATTPAHTGGLVDVEVRNPDLSSVTFTGAYTYTDAAGLFALTSSAFEDGDRIPEVHTCLPLGADTSPPLRVENAPDGTDSIAIYVYDIDAAAFMHWTAWGLPPNVDLPAGANIAAFGGAEGMNDFPGLGYGGPCPPSGTHRYLFHAVALDATYVPPDPGATPMEFLASLSTGFIDGVGLMGTYGVASPADGLAFVGAPTDTGAGLPFAPAVRVRATEGGSPVPDGTPVTLLIESGPADGRLVNGPGQNGSEFPTAATVGGVATFSGLAIDRAGTYILNATSGSAYALSGDFEVGRSGAPWPMFHRDPGASGALLSGRADLDSDRTLTEVTLADGNLVTASPVIVDVDLDGDLDLIAVNDVSTAGGAMVVRAFEQQAGGALAPLWSYTIPTESANPAPPPAPNDGFANIAVGVLDGELRVAVYSQYRVLSPHGGSVQAGARFTVLNADSGGLVGAFGIADMTFSRDSPPVIGDVNGDGVPEIVFVRDPNITDPINGNKRASLVGVNVAAGSVYKIFDTGLAASSSSSNVVLGELRAAHDGLEVVVADLANQLWLCRPSATDAVCSETFTTASPVRGLALADVDGDGNPEIVINEASGTQILETDPALALLATLPEGAQYNTPATADLDGDGATDIANVDFNDAQGSTHETGDVSVRGLGPAEWNKGTWTRAGTPGVRPLDSRGGGILVDASLDGVPEFLFGSADGSFTAANVRDTTAARPPQQRWNETFTGVTLFGTPAAGDLNGDCRPEIVVGASSGRLQILAGATAGLPSAPSFNAPVDYTLASGWTGPLQSPGDGLQAQLAWNAPAATGGLPVVEYRVYRGASEAFTPDGNPLTGNRVGIWPSGTPPTPANPFVDDLSQAGEGHGTYHYKVAAVTCRSLQGGSGTVDGGVAPTASFAVEVMPAKAPRTPADSISAGGVPAYGTESVAARIQWTAPLPNAAHPHGCGPALGYNVYRATAPNPDFDPMPRNEGLIPAANTIFEESGLAPGNTYNYAVRAANCVGEGNATATQSVPVLAPANVTGLTAVASPSRVTLSWNRPAPNAECDWIEGYRIHRSQAAGFTPAPDTLLATILPEGVESWPRENPPTAPAEPARNHTDLTVVNGQTFHYRVTAVNCVGEGGASAEVAATPEMPLNQGPVITAPAGHATDEDVPIAFSAAGGTALSIADPDAGGGALRVSLAVTQGILTLPGTTGLTLVEGGSGNASFTYTGSQMAWNAALNGMAYAPPPEACAATGAFTTLTLTADDQGASGVGGAQSSTASLPITVRCVNDRPVFNATIENPPPTPTGAQVIPGLIRGVDEGGGANEDGQTIVFDAVTGQPLKFSVQPAIKRSLTATATTESAAAGAFAFLTYTPAPGADGTAEVCVRARDNGGSAHGGNPNSHDALADYPCFTIIFQDGVPPTIGPLTATSTAPDRVLLQWSPAASDNTGVANLTIHRGPAGFVPGPGNVVATQPDVARNATEHTDATATPGGQHCYVVRVRDAGGLTAQTAPACATTPLVNDTVPPTIGTLSATAAGPSRVDLAWGGANDTFGLLRLEVHRGASPGFIPGPATRIASNPADFTVAAATFSDAEVEAETTYCYVVVAVDGAGNNATSNEDCAETPIPGPFELLSTAFADGAPLPYAQTCAGGHVSPPLSFTNRTRATTHLALIMFDPDASEFIHWMFWDLPANVSSLPAGADIGSLNGTEGENSAGSMGYTGACPTSGTHTYLLYAFQLNAPLGLPASTSVEGFLAALPPRAIGVDELTATATGYPSVGPGESPSGSAAEGPLTASAGSSQTVLEGTTVVLAGSGGNPRSMPQARWTQVDGPLVALRGQDQARAEFTAPSIDGFDDLTLRFRLTLTDAEGQVATAEVTVIVQPFDMAPVADAAAPLGAEPGETVRLDGTASRDPENRAITYAWTQEGGTTVELAGRDNATASFRVPAGARPGDAFTFRLVVRDSRHASAPDTVTVRVVGEAGLAGTLGAAVGPDGVSFEAPPAEEGAEYLWDFGDGNTSTERDPTHAYGRPGRYGVTLLITSEDRASSLRYTAEVEIPGPDTGDAANPLTVPKGERGRDIAMAVLWTLGSMALVGLAVAGGVLAWRARSGKPKA